MNILIIVPDYPDNQRSVFTFVKQVVDKFASLGNNCYVIAPYRITFNHRYYKEYEIQRNPDGSIVTILRPNHLSFSTISILGFSPSSFLRRFAIKHALKKLPWVPDVIYAHFWRCGREIYTYAKNNNIPLFIASGESQIPQDDVNESFIDFYNYVSGVICVSTKNMEESINLGLTKREKCIVLPNGIDKNLFFKKDKDECRMKLGFPKNTFIISFCGAFIHRKGVKILSEAIEIINDNNIYSIFLGRPLEELPTCRNILFQGPVQHNQLVDYLNASDVFVLPTLHEGCCNAIIEAMACGLPIISSDLPFNWDVLNENNSILIDPTDCNSVSKAIFELKNNNELRERLAHGAFESSQKLAIEERVKRILSFINEKIN